MKFPKAGYSRPLTQLGAAAKCFEGGCSQLLHGRCDVHGRVAEVETLSVGWLPWKAWCGGVGGRAFALRRPRAARCWLSITARAGRRRVRDAWGRWCACPTGSDSATHSGAEPRGVGTAAQTVPRAYSLRSSASSVSDIWSSWWNRARPDVIVWKVRRWMWWRAP